MGSAFLNQEGLGRQYTASISCLLCMVMSGSGLAFFTPLMVWLRSPQSEIPMTSEESSWIVASLQIGALVSPLPAGYIADRFGRKWTLLMSSPLSLLSWILLLFTRSVHMVIFCRILQGLATGIVFAVAPVYVAEISSPKIRGQLVGHMQTMNYIGNLYAFCIGPYVPYSTYILVCSVVPALFFFSFVFMPESPYFLLMGNKKAEAEKSLMWLRGRGNVKEELGCIERSVEEDLQLKGRWSDLVATPAARRALLIVQVVCFVKYFTGMVAVQTYITQTFKEDRESPVDGHILTILVGLVLASTTFVAAYISDTVGRKPLLIMSTLGAVLFTFTIGLYYFLQATTSWNLASFTWIMYVCVFSFCIIDSLGLGPLMQTVQAEFFPSSTRGLGGGVTGITGALASFIVMKQYQVLSDLVGVYLNFWIFSLAAFSGAVLIWRLFPETAGKTLGEIQSGLRSTTSEASPEEGVKPPETAP